MDPAIDFCTQLGVESFWFIKADRVDEKWSEKRIKSFTRRAVRKMIASIKQSQASILPHIYPITELDELLRMQDNFDYILYGDPYGLPSLAGLGLQTGARYLLLVGPTADFSSREKHFLAQLKAIPLSLGKRRLRTETAAVIITAKLLTFLKEI